MQRQSLVLLLAGWLRMLVVCTAACAGSSKSLPSPLYKSGGFHDLLAVCSCADTACVCCHRCCCTCVTCCLMPVHHATPVGPEAAPEEHHQLFPCLMESW
jgi:hypothetical protein